MLVVDFDDTIDSWVRDLDNYTLTELRCKPSPLGWSLGQLYFHLVKNTQYYIEQAKICLSSNDQVHDEASPEAIAMFTNNEFPNAIIEGPDTNISPPQPNSKEDLKNALLNLKQEVINATIQVSHNRNRGKKKHPGLGYFSANDWLQFADMHFRHHLRQKKRINDFLKTNNDR